MKEKFFEYDHHPEVVENGKALRRIEKLNIKEDLISPESRVKFFSSLTDEQFKKMFCYINSITQGNVIDYEYQDGQLPFESTPSLENKEALMNKTFEVVRDILSLHNEEEISEEKIRNILRKAGLTLAGAINYIHPKLNGNGRTARVLHYLLEYGSERGEKLFEDELYTIIAKTPVYEGETALAVDTTPPTELMSSLSTYASREYPLYNNLDSRVKAEVNIRLFLKMMKGDITVPIHKESVIINNLTQDTNIERIPANEINGDELYEKNYIAHSTTPNRNRNDINQDAQRTISKRGKDLTNKLNTIVIPMEDYV